MRNLKVGTGDIRLLEYRPDGTGLIALDVDSPTSRARLFPLPDGADRRSVDLTGTTMAVAPDGRRVAHVAYGVLRVWDADTGSHPAYRPWPPYAFLSGLAFSADGAVLYLTGMDMTARRLLAWDLAAAAVRWQVDGVSGAQLAGAPDGLVAVARPPGTGDRSRPTGVVFVRDGTVLGTHPFPAKVERLRFSPDGGRLAVVRANVIHLLRMPEADEAAQMVGHRRGVTDVSFSPDGRLLATAGSDERVRFWDGSTGRPVGTFAWRIGPVGAVAFSPDGLTCAAGGSNGRVVIWDVDV